MERIIYEAYCNELANDKFGVTLTNKRSKYNNDFYFKNYKITNLSNKKFYFFYTLSTFYKKIWLISIIYFTFQFIVSIFILKKDSKIFKNIAFIDGQKSFYDISLIKISNLVYLKKSFTSFSSYLSFYDKILAYLTVYKVIYFIIKKRNSLLRIEYNSLKLQIYDLYLVCLFILILKNKKINFYTNSHYDRWVYIVSKLENINLNVVQHGFLTKEIIFPFKFERIEILYVYDKEFIDLFKYHFRTIKTFDYIKPNLKLKHTNNNSESIFIASSMISINLEKDLIRWLLLKNKYKIYIKLHPAYNYRNEFYEYKDKIEFIDYFPKVNWMISYNSFLGYEYKALGENVLWLKDYENNLDILYKKWSK